MDSDYGIPRELSDLQRIRSLYQPELPPCLQGTTVRVEFGDATTTADPTDALTIARAFPHTYGHPLAHFLRATAKVPDAQIITEFPPIRVGVVFCGRQSPGGHNVSGVSTMLSKFTIPTVFCLDFLVVQKVCSPRKLSR
ncbi:pyrophosphate--fructose 6-phosphate 1-phosphotransferase subunit alpha-like [Vigna umbellata]|uniref:pyrophosphate--fructose 6-phosphate 1-phosphotransferase subunit alpha-like n=1 Tax=Vigna umbellata TaxID=87088 RepID=UPI001F5E5DB9|nr:pyrophosphate--fructose 6-phosphate 1-phosphotransferase subunit alpha-like [Vigna umbellata]